MQHEEGHIEHSLVAALQILQKIFRRAAVGGEVGGENIQNVGVDDYSGGYQIGSASYLLFLLSVLIVYIFCQKWIMNGVVAGAGK